MLVPVENSNYIIFYDPIKQCFRYDHQTIHLSQVRWEKCNWSTRYLLCQDDILHQTMGTNDNVRQMQIHDYANQTNRKGIHIPIVTPKNTYLTMKIRQDDEVWIGVPLQRQVRDKI